MAKKKKTEKKVVKSELETYLDIVNALDADSRARTLFHLDKVKETTGEILVEDVEYCLNLTNRIKKFVVRKFGSLQK